MIDLRNDRGFIIISIWSEAEAKEAEIETSSFGGDGVYDLIVSDEILEKLSARNQRDT